MAGCRFWGVEWDIPPPGYIYLILVDGKGVMALYLRYALIVKGLRDDYIVRLHFGVG
jgi:hypothetical protein